jgi:large subunit ribosomal protein L32e
MPDEPTTPAPAEAPATAPPRPKRTRAKPKSDAPAKAAPAPAGEKATATATDEESDGPKSPKRAAVAPATARLLRLRDEIRGRRPIFGRQAANRYYRIGRDGAWRRPRGLQSKQRRHYGYRAQIVSVGYRSPARVRGLVPSGFRPILVRTETELDALDGRTQAAIIARTVGTRRRLVLEEAARKLGIRVLNPIVKSESEA